MSQSPKLLTALRSERGTMIPMYVVFLGIILAMLTVVIDSTQVFIYQRRLHSVADGASLAGADGIDDASIYEDGLTGNEVKLLESAVDAKIAAYMAAANQAGMTCQRSGFTGTEITVTCNGNVELPIANWVVANREGVPVTASASARAFTQG